MLQVAPFAPHRPLALGQGQMNNPQEMEYEMTAVKQRMTAVRAHAYRAVNHLLKPRVEQLRSTGYPLERIISNIAEVLPATRSIAELLKVNLCPCVVCCGCVQCHAGRPQQ